MKLKDWWNKVCILHNWSKWEASEEKFVHYSIVDNLNGIPDTQHLQTRVCQRCGRTQKLNIEY